MTTTPQEMNSQEELEQQVHDITQKMLIALSEWQAGAPVDYETAKRKGRETLMQLITQKQLEEVDRFIKAATNGLAADANGVSFKGIIKFAYERKAELTKQGGSHYE